MSQIRPLLLFAIHEPAHTLTSTLSLHDALPIYRSAYSQCIQTFFEFRTLLPDTGCNTYRLLTRQSADGHMPRSEEHTSELQSRGHLVCRLLLEKKNIHIVVCQPVIGTQSIMNDN